MLPIGEGRKESDMKSGTVVVLGALVVGAGLAVATIARAGDQLPEEPIPGEEPEVRLEGVTWGVASSKRLWGEFDLVNYEDYPVEVEVKFIACEEPSRRVISQVGPVRKVLAPRERTFEEAGVYVGGYSMVSAEIEIGWVTSESLIPVIIALQGSGVRIVP